MREIPPPSPAVVVGIDGSRAGISAALWAIDEAVDRDLPLRLVCAIEPRELGRFDADFGAHDFAAAEIAVREAVMAIESVDKPVKIEVEIVQGRPVAALLSASYSAVMICVGALGINRAAGKRLGSTPAGLAVHAHCPLAIVRQRGPHQSAPAWVVTEFDNTPDSTLVLDHAVAEARLRNAPLRVLTTWRPNFTDVHDTHASADGSRLAKANLERSLARWRRIHPDLDIGAVALSGSCLNYLARNADSIQLLVVGPERSAGLAEFTGPASHAALHDTNCSVLISERHGAL
jgi:nucleotide-binding universal stress UspA family protein